MTCVRDGCDWDPELSHWGILEEPKAALATREASVAKDLHPQDGKSRTEDLKGKELVVLDGESSVVTTTTGTAPLSSVMGRMRTKGGDDYKQD